MIYYKLIERGQPGVAGGGQKKFYASINRGRTINLDALSERISEVSPLSPLDIKSALLAFLSIIPDYLLEGRSVDLGGFGKLIVTLHSEGIENEDDFETEMIKGNRVHFQPGKKMKHKMKSAEYRKQQ